MGGSEREAQPPQEGSSGRADRVSLRSPAASSWHSPLPAAYGLGMCWEGKGRKGDAALTKGHKAKQPTSVQFPRLLDPPRPCSGHLPHIVSTGAPQQKAAVQQTAKGEGDEEGLAPPWCCFCVSCKWVSSLGPSFPVSNRRKNTPSPLQTKTWGIR